jgi:hypothetical protein
MVMTRPKPDRSIELMAGAAAGDLTDHERTELAGSADPSAQDELMRAAALAQMVFLLGDPRQRRSRMSPLLKAQLLAAARATGGRGRS